VVRDPNFVLLDLVRAMPGKGKGEGFEFDWVVERRIISYFYLENEGFVLDGLLCTFEFICT
jgi:hypothetical protein